MSGQVQLAQPVNAQVMPPNNQQFEPLRGSVENPAIALIMKEFIAKGRNADLRCLKTAETENGRFIAQLQSLGSQLKNHVEQIDKVKISLEELQKAEKDNHKVAETIRKANTLVTNLTTPALGLAVYLGGGVFLAVPAFTLFATTATEEALSPASEPVEKKSKPEESPAGGVETDMLEQEWFKNCQKLIAEFEAPAPDKGVTITNLLSDAYQNGSKASELKRIATITAKILKHYEQERDKLLEEINATSMGNIVYNVINGLLVKTAVLAPQNLLNLGGQGLGLLANVAGRATGATANVLSGMAGMLGGGTEKPAVPALEALK